MLSKDGGVEINLEKGVVIGSDSFFPHSHVGGSEWGKSTFRENLELWVWRVL